MGTNFYLVENICPHCSRGDERIHIGKSSAGWCFSLHVHPDREINNLDDWRKRWSRDDTVIMDEYGHSVTPNEMEGRITQRSWEQKEPHTQDWLRRNCAAPGPNGLTRHALDGRHCIAHGEGTYDLIAGEFS